MPTLAKTAHRAPDGRLMFALASFAIGLTMLYGAGERQPTIGFAQHTLAEPPAAINAAALPRTRLLAAPRRELRTPSILERHRKLAATPRAPLTVIVVADPRDDLLALAALQRRWGLPSSSYATGFVHP